MTVGFDASIGFDDSTPFDGIRRVVTWDVIDGTEPTQPAWTVRPVWSVTWAPCQAAPAVSFDDTDTSFDAAAPFDGRAGAAQPAWKIRPGTRAVVWAPIPNDTDQPAWDVTPLVVGVTWAPIDGTEPQPAWTVAPGTYPVTWDPIDAESGLPAWRVIQEVIPPEARYGWQVRIHPRDNPSTLLAVVPAWKKIAFSKVLSDKGAARVELDPADPWVAENRDLLDEELYWTFWWLDVPRFGFWSTDVQIEEVDVVREGGEATTEDRLVAQGAGPAEILTWPTTLPPGFPDHNTLARGYTNARALRVFCDLFDEAKARGWGPPVARTFTRTVDSDGIPWVDNATLEVKPGQNLYQQIRQYAEWVNADWLMDTSLNLHAARAYGRDLSDEVVFFGGHSIRSAQLTATNRELVTDVYVADADGAVTAAGDATRRTRHGRRERWIEASGPLSPATRSLIAGASLARGDRLESRSLMVDPDVEGRVVFADYDVGDTVGYVVDPDGPPRSARLVALSFELEDQPACELTFDSIVEREAERFRRQLDALLSPGPVVATPGDSGNIAPNQPLVIGAPVAINVNTQGFPDLGMSVVRANWQPPPGVSGVVAYDTELERIDDGALFATQVGRPEVTFEPMVPNALHRFRVRAVTRTGQRGVWSTWFTFLTAPDTGAPSTPGGLQAFGGLRSVIVNWSQVTDVDVAWGAGVYEVQIAENAAFTVGVRSRIVGGTVVAFTDLAPVTTYWVRVRAIDSSQNAGAWTAVVSVATQAAGTTDIGPNAVTTPLLAAGAVVADKIAAGAVIAAKIAADAVEAQHIKVGALEVSKIGPANNVLGVLIRLGANGQIELGSSSTSLPGIRITAGGIFGRRSGGQESFRLDASSGDAIFRGLVEASRFVVFSSHLGSGLAINVNNLFTVDHQGNVVASRITLTNTGGSPSLPTQSPTTGNPTASLNGAVLSNVTITGNSKGNFGGIYIGPWQLGDMPSFPQIRWGSGASISNRGGGITLNTDGTRVATVRVNPSTNRLQFLSGTGPGLIAIDTGQLFIQGRGPITSISFEGWNVLAYSGFQPALP